MTRYTRLLLKAVFSLVLLLTSPVSADVSVNHRWAIQDLMSRYAAAWDSKDAERHVALFTEDATAQIIYEGSVLSETSSNKERMERTLNRLSEFTASGISTRHILSNMILENGPEGKIIGETYFYVVLILKGKAEPIPKYSGVYRDTFIKTEEGWKISHHEAHLDQKL